MRLYEEIWRESIYEAQQQFCEKMKNACSVKEKLSSHAILTVIFKI